MCYRFCNEPRRWIPIIDSHVVLQLAGGEEEQKTAYPDFDESSTHADHNACYLVESVEDQ